MSNATFQVTLSGGTEEADGNAAKFIVARENERREALNAADPDATPLALLPITPVSALQASYEATLEALVLKAHLSYVDQSAREVVESATIKERWAASTNAQRQAALDALAPAN